MSEFVPSRRLIGRRPRGVVALLVTLALALVPFGASSATAAVGDTQVYQGHTYSTSAGAASADKPQSKLWYTDGSWWAIMATTSTVNIFKLVDHAWVNTGTVVDSRIASTGDALWVEGTKKLYVASRTASGTGAIKVFRYTYSGGRYTRDTGFPVSMPGGGSESVSIARENTGTSPKLWITFTRGSVVYVSHTTTSDTSWVAPFRISGADTSVSADDISGVVTLPGKIGVMWSDQASSAFRFAVHTNGTTDAAANWKLETPLSGTRMADDHLNLKSLLDDDQGRVHAAIKTSLGDGGEAGTSASILVLSRTSAGAWTSTVAATVADNLTRPQLALDKTNKFLYVLQSTEAGGTVYYKSAPLGAIRFGSGRGTPLISWTGANVNNVSTTKDAVSAETGLVAIATDTAAARYYHAEMSLGDTVADTTPPTVTGVTPTGGATGVATTTKVTATFSEAMSAGTVNSSSFTLSGPGTTSVAATVTYDATARTATLTPSAQLSANTTYTASVSAPAADVAGNAVTPRTWSFTTGAAAPPTETVTVTATADSYVQDTTPSTNYGTAALLNVDASPKATAYMKFDLSPYTGRTIQSATLRVRATTSGSTGTQAVKLVTDDAWTETGLTYNNRPALGTATLGTLGPTSTNTNYSVTLNAAQLAGEAGQPLSLGIDSTSTDGVDIGSRETTTKPQLVLVLQGP